MLRSLNCSSRATKRLIASWRIAYDRTYSEREVNQIIMEFYDDFCTLRREMIGFGLMTRDHEVYRRVRKE